jgi:hypothetical protein
MTSVVDVWRAIDPAARLASGAPDQLGRAVRAVARTRAMSPHLPPPADGQLLVADGRVVGDLASLVAGLREAELEPAAVLLAGGSAAIEPVDEPTPVLVSDEASSRLVALAETYLADERAALDRLSAELRLACAEAALADPRPSTPAGLTAMRLRRGVAVTADGELQAVHARPAGRGLAARFTALHQRLLLARSPGQREEASRRTRDGIWLMERAIRPGAAVWLFDDVPFAAVDAVAADALRITLRALLQRPPPAKPAMSKASAAQPEVPHRDELLRTLLAVARANGRVAPAARELGVHRNTVLYRLRRGRDELGLDPRRPVDALRLLREAEGH